jgi:DNA-binding ferritin-like protein (Dps family)
VVVIEPSQDKLVHIFSQFKMGTNAIIVIFSTLLNNFEEGKLKDKQLEELIVEY